MNPLKLLLLSAIFMAIIVTLIAAPSDDDQTITSGTSTTSPAGPSGRFLASTDRFRRHLMTCNRYPRVCRLKGSPGPDCCRKRCVNVMKDRFNCGRCGKNCRYSETCCKGKCKNIMFDRKNCGGCNKMCKKGSSCVYGMCSYA